MKYTYIIYEMIKTFFDLYKYIYKKICIIFGQWTYS